MVMCNSRPEGFSGSGSPMMMAEDRARKRLPEPATDFFCDNGV
jgi:hypothetical protein